MKLNSHTLTDHHSPLETKPLVWKGQEIPEYFIRNDGILYKGCRQCSSWIINGRNYSLVSIDGHNWTYRIDYMVAYTFLGMRNDAIRLIHINDDISDDHVDNLIWYRKVDVIAEYKDYVIIEPDGSILEEWRPCKLEYNNNLYYEISNLGLVRDKEHQLIRTYESHGYRVFYYLDEISHTTRVKAIHRAVAEAFIPNPNGYVLVNHLDGNKFNDIVVNLEWASSGMNSEHAYLQGLTSGITYTKSQICVVCELLTKGIPHVHISNMTGVDRKTISDVYRGRRWKDVSSNYTMPSKKWTPELKSNICELIISGKKGKEIFDQLNMPYDQSSISFYERMRRELKSLGKIT